MEDSQYRTHSGAKGDERARAARTEPQATLSTSHSTSGGTIHIHSGVIDGSNFRIEEPALALAATLTARDGTQIYVELPDESTKFRVGRDWRECDASAIVLADLLVSRVHMAICVVDGQPMVQDLGSTNGTFVDEVRVEDLHPLANGTTIRLGRTELVFQEGCQDD